MQQPIIVVARPPGETGQRSSCQRLTPAVIRHQRIGVVTANDVQRKEHVHQNVSTRRKAEARPGSDQRAHKSDYEHVLQNPGLAIEGIERENTPLNQQRSEQSTGKPHRCALDTDRSVHSCSDRGRQRPRIPRHASARLPHASVRLHRVVRGVTWRNFRIPMRVERCWDRSSASAWASQCSSQCWRRSVEKWD